MGISEAQIKKIFQGLAKVIHIRLNHLID